MSALWPNGKSTPGDVWHEYGPRAPIWTPNGPTSSFHSGIDIGPWSSTLKTWLLSPVDGEIIHAGYDEIFGNRVVVYAQINGDDVEFWLCHGRTGSMRIRKGDIVSRKQQLQLMGETGKASGVHVHFEIHVNGARVDPRDFYRSAIAAGGNSTPASTKSKEDDTMIPDSMFAVVDGVPSWCWINWSKGTVFAVHDQDNADIVGAYMGSVKKNFSGDEDGGSTRYKNTLALLKKLNP